MNHVVRGRPDLPEGMPEAGFQFRVLKAEAKIEQALWLNVLPFKDQLLTHFTEHDSDHKVRGANEGRLGHARHLARCAGPRGLVP